MAVVAAVRGGFVRRSVPEGLLEAVARGTGIGSRHACSRESGPDTGLSWWFGPPGRAEGVFLSSVDGWNTSRKELLGGSEAWHLKGFWR